MGAIGGPNKRPKFASEGVFFYSYTAADSLRTTFIAVLNISCWSVIPVFCDTIITCRMPFGQCLKKVKCNIDALTRINLRSQSSLWNSDARRCPMCDRVFVRVSHLCSDECCSSWAWRSRRRGRRSIGTVHTFARPAVNAAHMHVLCVL